MLLLLGLQRVAYLSPAVAGLASPVYRSAAVNAGLLTIAIAWNVTLFSGAARRGWFTAAHSWLDLPVAVTLLLAMSANLHPGVAGVAPDWATRVAQGSAALIGAAIARPAYGVAALCVLGAAQTVATAHHYAGSAALAVELFYALNALVCFALVVGFGVRYLRLEGVRVDRAGIRFAHRRALHDTALATLTAIARGGLDHRGPQIRQRCARDADYLRRLLAGEAAGPESLQAALHDAVDAAEAVGLRVRYLGDRLPADLPAEVVGALGHATREALTNVAKHAGGSPAWVTATWERGQVRITVVDRGRGFDPTRTGPGYGLRWSIMEGLTAVAGSARITSEPGGGTCVELTWHR